MESKQKYGQYRSRRAVKSTDDMPLRIQPRMDLRGFPLSAHPTNNEMRKKKTYENRQKQENKEGENCALKCLHKKPLPCKLVFLIFIVSNNKCRQRGKESENNTYNDRKYQHKPCYSSSIPYSVTATLPAPFFGRR